MNSIETPSKKVVVVLPVFGDLVVMQLRDQNRNIDAPGCWGFFGGAIGPDESPLEASIRELYEELHIQPETLYPLGCEVVSDLNGLVAYAFCCHVKDPSQVILGEGTDLAWVSTPEILRQRIYSPKMKHYFPVVKTYLIEMMVRRAFQCLKNP